MGYVLIAWGLSIMMVACLIGWAGVKLFVRYV
jgi:hypothetical protein